MNNKFSPLIDLLKELWLPITGFISAIILISQFAQLWRGDFDVYTFVALLLSMCIVLASLIFVGFSKIPSPVLSGRLIYRYPSYVLPARIGIVILLLIISTGAGLYVYNRINAISPDIIIAEFDSRYATKTYEVATRIEDDLINKLK